MILKIYLPIDNEIKECLDAGFVPESCDITRWQGVKSFCGEDCITSVSIEVQNEMLRMLEEKKANNIDKNCTTCKHESTYVKKEPCIDCSFCCSNWEGRY